MAATSSSWNDLRKSAALLPRELVVLLDKAAVDDADFGSSAVPALDFALERAVDIVVSLLADGPSLQALPEPGPGPMTLGRSIRYLADIDDLVSERVDLSHLAGELPRVVVPISPSDAPAAFEVRRVVQRLTSGDLGGMDRWSEDSVAPRLLPEIEKVLAESGSQSPKPVSSTDLLFKLVEIRNQWSHTGSGQAWVGEFGEVHLRPLLDLARFAAFELLVVDPLATILHRWVPATVKSVTVQGKGENRTEVIDLRYEQGGRPERLEFDSEETNRFAEGERWLVDTAPSTDDGEDPEPRLVCPFGSALDVLRSRAGGGGAVVEVDAAGSARLMAGVAAGREREGRFELLCLPTSLTVTVSLQPDRNGSGGLVASSSRWEEGIRCAKAGAQHVASALRAGSVLAGEIGLEPADAPVFDGLQGATAVAVAAARAVFSGLGATAAPTRMGDELQVDGISAAMGSPQPWRDLFGWVNSETGDLIGGQIPCPAMDLLLVVPIRGGHRARAVQVRRLFQADNPQYLPCQSREGEGAVADLDVDGSHMDRIAVLERLATNDVDPGDDRDRDARNEKLRQVIGALCTDVANALNGVEPNPNLALLQPLREQFDALGLLASPFTWTAGLLFAPDAPGLAPAQQWLESLRLPDTVDVVKTSTHATT